MGQKICLTDCTLRDGSYQNDFGFTAQDTFALSRTLDQAGFPEIEVGHGLGLCGATKFNRAAGATDYDYVVAGREGVRHGLLGVFAIPGIATLDAIREAARLGLDFLKIGVVAGKPEPAEPLVRVCQEEGVTPIVFFMQSSLVSPDVLAQNANTVAQWDVSTVYVADSAGFMMPGDITDYVSRIRERTTAVVGFHGHNNLHLVMANTIAAISAGATKIDCTLRGLGRSSGNPQTEALVLVLRRLGYETGVDASATIGAAEDHINSRLPGYGNESMDLAVGYAGLHSRFVGEVERIAAENGLLSIDLLLAVGERGKPTERLELIADIARRIKAQKLADTGLVVSAAK
jgi:4-hydroxy 2-oxovalerate aldolase/long-chain acyl-CoA synthetase